MDVSGQWASTVGFQTQADGLFIGYKDATPTRAWSMGNKFFGGTVSDDMVVGMYSAAGGGWRETLRALNAGGLHVKNATTVPGTIAGGGTLYVEAGALKFKGSAGTITTVGAA